MSPEAASFIFPYHQILYDLFNTVFETNSTLFSSSPGRGYPFSTPRHQATTSFLVAGSYMGVEPSVIPEVVWTYLFHHIEQHYSICLSTIRQVRVQLNRYGNKKAFHPLSLYPHTDSSPSQHRPIFINIPISKTTPVRTDFYEFLPTHKSRPHDDLFDIDGVTKSHSPTNLTSFLLENKHYCDSKSLILKLWKRHLSLVVEPGYFGTFRSDYYHAPYIESGDFPRNSVGIFIYYSVNSSAPPPNFDKYSLFTQTLSDSFHYVNNEPVSFI